MAGDCTKRQIKCIHITVKSVSKYLSILKSQWCILLYNIQLPGAFVRSNQKIRSNQNLTSCLTSCNKKIKYFYFIFILAQHYWKICCNTCKLLMKEPQFVSTATIPASRQRISALITQATDNTPICLHRHPSFFSTLDPGKEGHRLSSSLVEVSLNCFHHAYVSVGRCPQDVVQCREAWKEAGTAATFIQGHHQVFAGDAESWYVNTRSAVYCDMRHLLPDVDRGGFPNQF